MAKANLCHPLLLCVSDVIAVLNVNVRWSMKRKLIFLTWITSTDGLVRARYIMQQVDLLMLCGLGLWKYLGSNSRTWASSYPWESTQWTLRSPCPPGFVPGLLDWPAVCPGSVPVLLLSFTSAGREDIGRCWGHYRSWAAHRASASYKPAILIASNQQKSNDFKTTHALEARASN